MNDKLSQHIEDYLEEIGYSKTKNLNKISWIQYTLSGILAVEGFIILYFFIIIAYKFTKPDDIYQNLITVVAGIAALIFAIFILISETLRDDKQTYRARVLLEESNIKLASIASLIVFCLIISFEILHKNTHQPIFLILCIISVFSLAIWVIYIISKIIKIFLDNKIFEKAKLNYIVKNITKKADFLFFKRIGNDILLPMLSGKIKYSYFYKNENDSYYIQSNMEGIVQDINLDKLQELLNLLGTGKIIKNAKSDPEQLATPEPIKLYLHVSYMNLVNKNTILWSSNWKEDDISSELKNLIQSILDIRNYEDDYLEPKNTFLTLKDNFITAITNKHSGEAYKLSQLYLKIWRNFLEYLGESGYYIKNQQKEINVVLGDLDEIRSLQRDIREIISKSIDSKDIYIIEEVVFLPIQIAWIALQYNDKYLFREYIVFLPYLYRYSLKYENSTEKDIHERLTKKIFMNLRDIKYGIQANSNKDTFVTEFLYVFLKLLREILSSDNKDLDSFRRVIRMLVGIKEDFKDAKDINIKINEILWGITGWLVFKYKENHDYKQEYDLVEPILLNNNIENLTDKFVEICDKEYGFFHEMEEWDRDSTEAEYGEISTYNSNPYKYRNYLYCILALKLLNREDIETLYLSKDNKSPKIETLGRVKSQLYPILDEIIKDKDNWKFVLTDNEVTKIDKFKNLFDAIELRYQDGEAQKKRKANVPDSNIDIFKESVIKSFWESVRIRKFMQYEISTEKPSDDVPLFGFNRLLDKSIFLDDSSSKSFGQSYGEGLARGENSSLFDQISDKCENIEDDLNLFMKDKGNNFIVLTSAEYMRTKQFAGDELDIKDYSTGIINYKDMIVHQISHNQNHDTLLFVDKSKIGKLIQYTKDTENIFDVSIHVLSDPKHAETKQQLIQDNDWIQKKDNYEEYLQEQVSVKITEQWKYEAEAFIGYKFHIGITKRAR